MPKPIIRAATPQDRDALIRFEIGLQSFEATVNPLEQPFSRRTGDRYVNWILGNVRSHNGLCLIAEINGRPIGFTAGWIEDGEDIQLQYRQSYRRQGYIAEGFVMPKYRKQGVYSSLIAQLEKYFRANKVRWVRRNTLAKNRPLQAAAKAQGYKTYLFTYGKKLAA